MIGMARFPVGKDDGAGTEFADDSSEGKFVLAGRLHVGVGDVDGAAPGNFQDFCGCGCFFGADFRSAASAHFAGGEIEYAGFVALCVGFKESAAAGEFDVVGVGGDCQ